jgi:hypothetical protein
MSPSPPERDTQIDLIRMPQTLRAERLGAAHIGGSARSYQGIFVPSARTAVPVTDQAAAPQDRIFIHERARVNVRFYRDECIRAKGASVMRGVQNSTIRPQAPCRGTLSVFTRRSLGMEQDAAHPTWRVGNDLGTTRGRRGQREISATVAGYLFRRGRPVPG